MPSLAAAYDQADFSSLRRSRKCSGAGSRTHPAMNYRHSILETFPIVKRKEIARHGEYRTRRVILEVYDAMAAAMQGGAPYVARLAPPPADARVAHEG